MINYVCSGDIIGTFYKHLNIRKIIDIILLLNYVARQKYLNRVRK
ncbi:Uncharacterised protein [Sphingobacterium thalpophilum]|uniref:Uncharacterized protein n=1 Tax=Sphingobacterium thalpophilum TaxID=259 RepID=A0A4U9UPG8_9SPHI|nr:Uncharacterised protein [Sphingobacterium thalpophilum]